MRQRSWAEQRRIKRWYDRKVAEGAITGAVAPHRYAAVAEAMSGADERDYVEGLRRFSEYFWRQVVDAMDRDIVSNYRGYDVFFTPYRVSVLRQVTFNPYDPKVLVQL